MIRARLRSLFRPRAAPIETRREEGSATSSDTRGVLLVAADLFRHAGLRLLVVGWVPIGAVGVLLVVWLFSTAFGETPADDLSEPNSSQRAPQDLFKHTSEV